MNIIFLIKQIEDVTHQCFFISEKQQKAILKFSLDSLIETE